MVLNYQRWTPPCGCSFEQEVDSETGEVKLLFTHSLCAGHENIAKQSKSKSKISKEEIIKKKEDAWKRNHDHNMNEFENRKEVKHIKNKINSLRATTLDPNTQLLADFYDEQKRNHKKQLDDFTRDRKLDMLIGLESDYALDAQEVYDYIVAHPEEQQIQEV